MARTKAAKKGTPERATLKNELLAVLNGKPLAAEDAAKRIAARKRFTGKCGRAEVARCAKWHSRVFALAADGTIRRKPTK